MNIQFRVDSLELIKLEPFKSFQIIQSKHFYTQFPGAVFDWYMWVEMKVQLVNNLQSIKIPK